MPERFQKLWKKTENPHLREILLGSGVALGIKVLAAGSAFVMSAVVARKLGAEEAGLFFLGMTIVSIAAAVGRLGLDNSVVRFIAGAQAEGKSQEVRAISSKALKWALSMCSLIGILVYLSSSFISKTIFEIPEFSPVLSIVAFAVPLVGMSTLYASTLKGLRKVAQSVITLNVAMPVAMLAGVTMFNPSSALSAGKVYVAACAFAVIVGGLWWQSVRPDATVNAVFPTKTLWASCAPLWTVVILQQLVMWSSQLLLGVWSSSESVAMFAASQRTATLISFVLVAVNTIVAPKFAVMYRQGDEDGLRYIAKLSVRLMLLAATPCLLFIWAFPEWILGFFGPDFKQASNALRVLALAQFINVVTGSVGFLLSMTGHEKTLKYNVLFGAIVGVVLAIILIPPFGLLGGAIATALAIASQHLLGVLQVYRVLGFNTLSIWRL